jgi:hypothetical protein
LACFFSSWTPPELLAVPFLPAWPRRIHEIPFDGYCFQLRFANDDIRIFPTRTRLDQALQEDRKRRGCLINAGSAIIDGEVSRRSGGGWQHRFLPSTE